MDSPELPMNSAIVAELQAIVGPRMFCLGRRISALTNTRVSGPRSSGSRVFPFSTDDVSRIVQTRGKHDVPIVGRGAGTGLSGGALARGGGMMIAFGRMNRHFGMDLENRRAVVQPGVL